MPEQEAQLSLMAMQFGTDTVHLVKDAALRFLEDTRFTEAVKLGEAALERGDYLSQAEMGKRIEQLTGF